MHRETAQKYLAHIILIISLCLFNCKGQDSPRQENEFAQTSEQKRDSTWVDPLFFIDDQICAWVRKIFQDSKGNLWFSTNHYGILRYNGEQLDYFDEDDGVGGGRVTEIVEDSLGNIWFGTAQGLTKYDGYAFTNLKDQKGLIDNEIWAMISDRSGTFWIGTMKGVSQFDGENFNSFPIPKANVQDTNTILSYDRVTSILEDKTGTIWFGLDGFGITKYDPSTEEFTTLTVVDGLPDNNVASLMEDSWGNIWIGTMFGGVSLYDGKSFTNFTKDGAIEGVEVYGIYEGKNGDIWIPAEGFGVYRYDGNSFRNYHELQGLPTGGIQCVFEDREGRFWLGGWGGLFRLNKSPKHVGNSFWSVSKDGPWDIIETKLK